MRTTEQRLMFLESIIEKLAYEIYEIRRAHTDSTHEWIDTSDEVAYEIWRMIKTFRTATFDDED